MAKRKGRRRGKIAVVAEQAKAYGVNVPKADAGADRFLSPNEIGQILNVTGEAVKQWLYQRRLPAVKLANGYWKVRVSDFEAFLQARNKVTQRRILIADARLSNVQGILEAVEQLGHQPVVAHSSTDALLKSMEHRPALFIVNLGIQDEESWKLVKKIRATKALGRIPILLLSESDLSDADAERAVKLEAQGFLKLPAEKATLATEMKRIVDRLN